MWPADDLIAIGNPVERAQDLPSHDRIFAEANSYLERNHDLFGE